MTKAFTLIELLVVVLIIGILSAIALPQYEKAVWKSRNTQLKQLVRSIVTAEQAYYMANGHYAGNFNELDIDLPLTPIVTTAGGNESVCTITVQGTDAVRKGKDFQVVLNSVNLQNVWVLAVYTEGPYKCTGFYMNPTEANGMGCLGQMSSEEKNKKFCEKMEQGVFVQNLGSWSWYNLP